MKHNKNILTAALLALLATPVAFAGDDANGTGTGEGAATNGMNPGDTQTATITIPEVSLIDVTNTVSATLTPPTDAGDNFATVTVAETTNYAISANISAAAPSNTRKIVATSTNVPAGWKFGIEMAAPTASGTSAGEVFLTNSTTAVDTVTGIKNVANHGLAMTVKIGPEDANTMPSYTVAGGKTVDIVYTITADQ